MYMHTLSGQGQTAVCFSDATFGCSGAPGGQKSGPTAGQQCCDDGFLSFFNEESCTICQGKYHQQWQIQDFGKGVSI